MNTRRSALPAISCSTSDRAAPTPPSSSQCTSRRVGEVRQPRLCPPGRKPAAQTGKAIRRRQVGGSGRLHLPPRRRRRSTRPDDKRPRRRRHRPQALAPPPSDDEECFAKEPSGSAAAESARLPATATGEVVLDRASSCGRTWCRATPAFPHPHAMTRRPRRVRRSPQSRRRSPSPRRPLRGRRCRWRGAQRNGQRSAVDVLWRPRGCASA
jgi:hypothetical protein